MQRHQRTPAAAYSGAEQRTSAPQSQIQCCPPELQILGVFPIGDFYVRDCYNDYYSAIFDSLTRHDKRGVTVTGTPGVGLSVFMAYFFLRYQREHPDGTVVIISYDDQSDVKHVVVWENGTPRNVATAQADDVKNQLSSDRDALFLLDGPPKGVPVLSHRHVAFTRPSDKWSSKVDDEPTHKRMFMPLWSLDELKDAATALGVVDSMARMDDARDFPRAADPRYADELAYRFAVFGGVARPCFATDKGFLAQQCEKIINEAEGCDFDTVEAMRRSEFCTKMNHRLYHHTPRKEKSCSSLAIASWFVEQQLDQRATTLHAQDRVRLLAVTEGVSQAATLRGHTLENAVHGILGIGRGLLASLIANPPHSTREISPSTPTEGPCLKIRISRSWSVGNFNENDDLTRLENGPYFRPESRTLEAIDSFYLIKGQSVPLAEEPWGHIEVVLFQVTVARQHPVKAAGLSSILKSLGISPKNAALVFAVAENRGSFKKQRITAESPLADEDNVESVSGIATVISKVLKKIDIRTVGQLRGLGDVSQRSDLDSKEKGLIANAKNALSRYETRLVVDGSEDHQALEQMPQFKWIVDSR